VTPTEAIAQAKRGALLPVYVLTGEERFLRDQVVVEIRAAALGGGIAAFNEDKFQAGEVDVDKVIGAARTVPMMAPKRFVLVRGVERWDSARDAGSDEELEGAAQSSREEKSGSASPIDKLAAYAASPIDSTCMVLVAEKIDGRRKLAALAKRQGFMVTCEPLEARALVAWIRDRARVKGHPMEQDVAELLAAIAGPELAYVNDALERLSLYAGAGAPIDEDAVADCVARVRTADTWALVDAVGERDLAAGMRILADVYDPRDRGLPLLGALAWSVRQLARFQAATAEGAGADEAARRAGVFQPMRARELASKARAFRTREVERWLLVLAETDLALKSSRRPADAILDDMLTRMCGAASNPGKSSTTGSPTGPRFDGTPLQP
jgi:DNA polymerase III subunit delta